MTKLNNIKNNTIEIINFTELKDIFKKKKIITKVGFDPTTPNLHLGHTILFEKMKQLQDYGCTITLLIGDCTTLIGDPTGQNTNRKTITKEEIKNNYKNYKNQIFKFLNKKKTKIINNSFWLNKVKMEHIIKLASTITVAKLLQREDFFKRYTENKSIKLHELLYPLLQAFDSVILKADIEIGGVDQKLNLILGRELQKIHKQKPQCIIMLPLLEGIDGKKKMSKSNNNHININETPINIFGKIMSISDNLMWVYYKKLNILTTKNINNKKKDIKNSITNHKTIKLDLALKITEKLHNTELALQAKKEFTQQFIEKTIPDNIQQITLYHNQNEILLSKLLHLLKITTSIKNAKRLITQNAIKIDNIKINNINTTIQKNKKFTLHAGKKTLLQILLI